MSTDADDLHQEFFVQCGNSAIEAIDDAVLASTDQRLEQFTKTQVAEILLAGFSRVLKNKTIGDSDRVAAEAIHGLVEGAIADDVESDLEEEIMQIVRMAFANFAEGLMAPADDELRRRAKEGGDDDEG